ncbi:hypothetical protein DAETH_27840 [Deinococcus aetherius]|uniref:Lipoprotein n=1 Tax=Deinococcus aetherius TaxID=200252 RepID=A0ABM8AG86_9DEIO|nr:hypothetical protein [Deinococcus aetherius]BDP42815.1 hypothetical protein DAETH_27840 [Deinococcus aetherius]
MTASPLRPLALALLLPGLLAACTGTEETPPSLRLAVLTDGGATVRTVTPGSGASDVSVPLGQDNRGVTLDTLPGGTRVALTLTSGIESRDVNLANPVPFAALPFTPVCLTSTVLSAARDRLLTLSDCATASGGSVNGPQQLALYRTDGSLVWTALLPTFTPPSSTTDRPPVRIAVIGDRAVVARPALGGGSETIRVAPENTGDIVATATLPLATPAIRDLAPLGNVIYAATDTGIQPLTDLGVPNAAATVGAFGSGRVDRLWTSASTGGASNLIAAWRDTTLSGNGSEPLRLWDNTRASAVIVANIAELRDVSFGIDGNLYALTRTTLTSYDTVFGLGQGNWNPTQLAGGLNDARAVTWLVP